MVAPWAVLRGARGVGQPPLAESVKLTLGAYHRMIGLGLSNLAIDGCIIKASQTAWRTNGGRSAVRSGHRALTVLPAGCGRVAQFPEPKPAPVFELQVIDGGPCPTAADPQLACCTVRLRNRDEKAGKGACVVCHYVRGGEALVGEGPSFRLVYDQAKWCGRRARRI